MLDDCSKIRGKGSSVLSLCLPKARYKNMNAVKIISAGNEEQGRAPIFMESSSSFFP